MAFPDYAASAGTVCLLRVYTTGWGYGSKMTLTQCFVGTGLMIEK